jgi:hypothetical protein
MSVQGRPGQMTRPITDESAVRYLGIVDDDARAIAVQIDV